MQSNGMRRTFLGGDLYGGSSDTGDAIPTGMTQDFDEKEMFSMSNALMNCRNEVVPMGSALVYKPESGDLGGGAGVVVLQWEFGLSAGIE